MIYRVAAAPIRPRRQQTQYTCMATSLAMCLTAYGMDPTEEEVNAVMGARPMVGASWEQLIAAAQHYGFRSTLICPATVETLKRYTDQGVPVVIAWNPEGREWSHASVVFDVGGETVKIADPNIPDPRLTVREIPISEFYSKWYERWPKYLVRRPALAVEREINDAGIPL